MVHCVAEKDFGRLGPAQVQMAIVVPRKTDATVYLDVLRRGVSEDLGAVGLRHGRSHDGVVHAFVNGPRRVTRDRPGRLGFEVDGSALVLYRLEAPDESSELLSSLCVVHTHLKEPLGPSNLLTGEGNRRGDQHCVEPRFRLTSHTYQASGCAVERESRLLSRGIHHVEGSFRHTRRGAIDREETRPRSSWPERARARRHSVSDERLDTAHSPVFSLEMSVGRNVLT